MTKVILTSSEADEFIYYQSHEYNLLELVSSPQFSVPQNPKSHMQELTYPDLLYLSLFREQLIPQTLNVD